MSFSASRLDGLLRPLEVKHNQEKYSAQGTNRWGNRDIYPILEEKRIWNAWAFFIYWATAGGCSTGILCPTSTSLTSLGICITSWTLGSSMIGIGLTAGQAVGAVLVGTCFASTLGFVAGQCGRVHHLGFMMMGRASFGLWGSYFSIMICVFESVIYVSQPCAQERAVADRSQFGVQSFYGGQAIVVILNAIFPQFLHLKNTLPESAGVTSQALIGFMLYFLCEFPGTNPKLHRCAKFMQLEKSPVFCKICLPVLVRR